MYATRWFAYIPVFSLLACGSPEADLEPPDPDPDTEADPGPNVDYDLCDGGVGECATIEVNNQSGDRVVQLYLFDEDCETYVDILRNDVLSDGDQAVLEIPEGSYCALLAFNNNEECIVSSDFTVFSGDGGGYYWKLMGFDGCDL